MAQPPSQNVAPPPPPPPGNKAALPPRPLAGARAAGAAGAAGAGPTMTALDPNQIAALQNPDGELPPEQGEANIHHGFFQQPWVQDVLPFVTSLALHAAIVIVGVVLYSAVKYTVQRVAQEEQIVIPEAQMANEMAGGVENPGLGGDPTRAAAQDKYDENTQPDGTAFERSDTEVADAAEGGEETAINPFVGTGTNTFRPGKGEGTGSGKGGGGRLAPFGAPGGGIQGPKGKVFGDGGNAKTIAFCCDSSGSMIDKFPSLKQELSKAIEGLSAIQQFSIVFFADEKAHTFEGGALVNATTENKRKANKWLEDLTTSGTSNPIPGLQIAFKSKPQLMYILTDGDFPNNNDVLATVASLNKGGEGKQRALINTIAFVSTSDDPTSESFLKFLTTLAEQNGGRFKRVAQDQLD